MEFLSEARDAMRVEKRGEGEFTVYLTLHENMTPFEGHFPDFKILPGVGQISLVSCAVRKIFGDTLLLHSSGRVKFTNPALPGAQLEINIKVASCQEGKLYIQAVITSQDKQIPSMRLGFEGARDL